MGDFLFEVNMPGNRFIPRFIKDLLNGVDVSTDGAFTANSDALLPTQKAVKTYVAANGPLPVHDLTGAGADYALAVGETAKLTFSAATSVPLHVATAEGEYEIRIIGNDGTTIGTAGFINLQPNNGTVTAGAIDYGDMELAWTTTQAAGSPSATSWADGSTLTSFILAYSLIIHGRFDVSTFTNCKSIIGVATRRTSSTSNLVETVGNIWQDTSTVWNSLGTLVFPFAQSGTVIIRRIL